MYLAFNAPHTPLQALKSDYDALDGISDHTLRVYAAMIRALDRNVGRVLDALEENGIDDNTLVIFTSDNGGANYVGLPDLNRPYRGWKATFFEGGIRVPFFMKWPAMWPQSAQYHQPVGHVDVFSTIAAAASVSLPADRVIDGVDLVPFVKGERSGRPHSTLFWRSGSYKTLRQDDWKLQVAEHPGKSWLFDLSTDPTEQHNVAAAEGGKVAELRATLDEIDHQQQAPLWPSLLEAPVFIDRPLNTPARPGEEYVYWAN
jgi:arylsulfatase A-like enzyme